MDSILPQLYKDYGQYSNWRNMPLDIDGLKPVERRVLLSAYKIARDKFVKSRQVDAYTIGHYHPHGSTYGTIVQLVRQGFLIGQGNFGTNIGVEPVGPAADRYTECQIHPKTTDMIFKYVSYVEWGTSELGVKEPTYLPAMFPVCLMGNEYTQGIGFGYKTYIPCYNIQDLYQRLLWLLNIRKRKPIIKPITDCEIVSPPEIIEQLLTTGSAKIDVKGSIEVNPRNNTIVLNAWPPGKRFETILNKFSAELDSGMVGFTDLSVDKTKIVFEILRERNRDKIFNDFVIKMNEVINGTISFETTVVDINHRVLVKPIDKMLLDTFNMFTDVNKNMLVNEIEKVNDKITEYTILEQIKPVIADGISKKMIPNQIIELIEKQTGVSPEISKELMSKYKISKLLSISMDTETLAEKKTLLQTNLSNIKEFVLQQYGGF